MKQSQLFTKTKKEAPKDEVSTNAQLLIKAGFVHKEMAGVYTYLPLGLRVLNNIQNIIREELNAIGAHEVFLTSLQSSTTWEPTNRWSDEVVDNWFKTTLKNGTELGLAFTHEEPITQLMKGSIASYKDLPCYAYQFQTKFRNEVRAKSGIMRGREFLMKDLYSFSKDKEEHDVFYEQMKGVYARIFDRIGIGAQTFLTLSSGGSFSKYSYEFQTITSAGEDIIMFDRAKGFSINKEDYSDEIFEDFGLNKDEFTFEEATSSEVGDIYSLGTKYAAALGLTYTAQDGSTHPVYMGSYGIGVPRVMGTVVEVHHDEAGMIWPKEIAPFQVHLVSLCNDSNRTHADALYAQLAQAGIDVLYDDRDERAGKKFADSDLIGIPLRIVISGRTLEQNEVEWKERAQADAKRVSLEEIIQQVQEYVQ
jgi:prolyl-tRNA synthetase